MSTTPQDPGDRPAPDPALPAESASAATPRKRPTLSSEQARERVSKSWAPLSPEERQARMMPARLAAARQVLAVEEAHQSAPGGRAAPRTRRVGTQAAGRPRSHETAAPPEPPLLLTPDQAFALLQIGRTLGWRLIHDGSLPTVRLAPRCMRVPRQALEALIAAGGVEDMF